MYLENVVVDAQHPQRLGRFWEELLGCATLTDEPDAFETRLSVPGGPALDLCFQRVSTPPTPNPSIASREARRRRPRRRYGRQNCGRNSTKTVKISSRPTSIAKDSSQIAVSFIGP